MSLLDLIVVEIETNGPISFSRYMELALYHPELGFYSTGGAGRRGDFITSPEVGPLFGAVVARALDSWWDALDRPERFTFVEVGAGPATLGRTILRAEPRCMRALEYVAVEISSTQRHRHPDYLTSLAEMPDRIETGVVFANELLDNLPFDVREYSRAAGWQDVMVGLDGTGLVEVHTPVPSGELPEPDLGSAELVRVPMQREAAQWMRDTLDRLGLGRLVVIDYMVDRYPTEPRREWLRTYSQHGSGGPALHDPGTKDITADVDISALSEVGAPAHEQSQRAWLVRHGIEQLVQDGKTHWIAHAAAPDLVAMEMRSRVNEAEALLDPGGLGGFAVLEWEVGAGRT